MESISGTVTDGPFQESKELLRGFSVVVEHDALTMARSLRRGLAWRHVRSCG